MSIFLTLYKKYITLQMNIQKKFSLALLNFKQLNQLFKKIKGDTEI